MPAIASQEITERLKALSIDLPKLRPPEACVAIATIFERSLKYLFKTYLGSITDHKNLLQYMEEKRASIDTCTFGQMIGLVGSTSFLEATYKIIHEETWRDKSLLLKVLNETNDIRINQLHNSPPPECPSSTVDYYVATMKKFLDDFGLIDQEPQRRPDSGESLVVEYLNSEVKLYKSLLEVLNAGAIDCVDVTYFSHRPPNTMHDQSVHSYYDTLDKMTKAKHVHLRRVLSIDDHDHDSAKLLWLLFDLFPRLHETLGSTTSVSLLKVGNRVSPGETSNYVRLINLILMYQRSQPDEGHVWLFGSHPEAGRPHEYVHLYGNRNIDIFQRLYNEMFDAAQKLNLETVREILRARWSDISADNLDARLAQLPRVFEQCKLPAPDMRAVGEVYRQVFAPRIEDNHDW